MKSFCPKNSVAIVLIPALLFGLIGCDTHKPSATTYASTTTTMVIVPNEPNTVWDKMANDFTFKAHQTNPRVERFIKQYSRENFNQLVTVSKQAAPYLYHVVNTLQERGLPAELALLPMIESEYRTTATSKRGAVGLWQLAAMTGRINGLKQDQWYDGRKDIDAATKVALNHLEYLYNRFNHDWLMALAAYNAGDARVAAAIRNNKKAGKPTDYWSLNLPQETQYFVPKFLSLVYLIKNYRSLDINLETVPNKPYFGKVKLSKQIHLEHAAKLAEVDVKEVKRLNAAYRSHITHPNGPHDIVLPLHQIATFKANLAALASIPKTTTPKQVQIAQNTTGQTVHVVNRGDTLHLIASKYKTTVKSIKHKNNLSSDIIRSGQKLSI
ncbi:MAG TPA: transglycosylase SLT domain-containing protein [Gammaproteobacteria bacterium]|nr:transglycosylase SLT domain-containing protein [Gammaproteobacteria bacterium]